MSTSGSVPSIAAKRALLSTTRIRFSPQIQHVRDVTIDRIVEQGLLLADSDKGLTEKELEDSGSLSFPDGQLIFTHLDVHNSITRLYKSGRLITVSTAPNRYRLSDVVRVELSASHIACEKRFERVLQKLFPGVDPKAYSGPFLDLLCKVFSELGQRYVRCLQGDGSRDDLVRLPNLKRSLEAICARNPQADPQIFTDGSLAFFRDADVDYETIKWNFGQNYYVVKIIGLDPSGYYLSDKIFGGSIVYLDTNVIIHVLEPLGRHHQSLEMLRKACQRLSLALRVCQISLDGLRRVVQSQRELIARVADEIPEELAPKIRGVFYAMYHEQQKASGHVDLDALFNHFESPGTALRSEYGIETVDDKWFDATTDSDASLRSFVDSIQTESKARRPWHPKTRRPAVHDAQILKWVERDRQQQNRNVWLLTLDNLLPGVLESPQPDGTIRPVAITLDALLQWISPITVHDSVEEAQFANIFSEAVKYMLLPQDQVFDLGDFALLADMELDSKFMPPEDVEGALRTVQAHAPELDLSNPADREKLAYEVAKFIKGPGRKFKEELARKVSEREAVEREAQVKLEEARQNALVRLQELQQQHHQEVEAREEAHKAELLNLAEAHWAEKQALESQVSGIRADLTQIRHEREMEQVARAERELRRSAYTRLWVSFALLIVLVVSCLYGALRYGKPDSDLQKLLNADKLFLGAIGVWFVLTPFIIGSRERFRVLTWPLRRLFKADETR